MKDSMKGNGHALTYFYIGISSLLTDSFIIIPMDGEGIHEMTKLVNKIFPPFPKFYLSIKEIINDRIKLNPTFLSNKALSKTRSTP